MGLYIYQSVHAGRHTLVWSRQRPFPRNTLSLHLRGTMDSSVRKHAIEHASEINRKRIKTANYEEIQDRSAIEQSRWSEQCTGCVGSHPTIDNNLTFSLVARSQGGMREDMQLPLTFPLNYFLISLAMSLRTRMGPVGLILVILMCTAAPWCASTGHNNAVGSYSTRAQ